MFREDQQIGQYTLIRKIGKGGFGEVWLAEKRSQFITKKVAVKLPLDEQVNFEAIRQEATLWEQASGHANVLPIIDADVYDGQVVIVSEYASGGSLADRLKTHGRFPVQTAIETTIGILNGLEYLHSRRIIHRDIKPQNILLQGDTPRLADFGISRAMQTAAISSTIIGTDAYMSPESFQGERTIQTDIWAVGVVLYQLLKGFLPFPQENPSERMYAILQEDFEPIPIDIPRQLKTIITKALSKLPENRYKTTGEMRGELRQILHNGNISESIEYNSHYSNSTSKFLPKNSEELKPYNDEETKIRMPKKVLIVDSEQDIYVLDSEPEFHKPKNKNQGVYDFYKHLKELTFEVAGKYSINPERNLEILKLFLNQSIDDPRKKLMYYSIIGHTATFHTNIGAFSFSFHRKRNLTAKEFLDGLNRFLNSK